MACKIVACMCRVLVLGCLGWITTGIMFGLRFGFRFRFDVDVDSYSDSDSDSDSDSGSDIHIQISRLHTVFRLIINVEVGRMPCT